MPFPVWKKYLSYLYEFHIESAPSEINPHLYVSLKNGRLQLSTANAVYSHEDLYLNFQKAFERFQFSHLKGKKVLILGFGLGSIPIILEKLGHKDFEYTGVELDENVIYLASKYIIPKIESNCTLIQADANLFMQQNQEKYDMICMDIFLSDLIPEVFQSAAFLQVLQDSLSPNGLLLFNRLAYTGKDKKDSDRYYHSIFQPQFSDAGKLDIHGNYILTNRANWFS